MSLSDAKLWQGAYNKEMNCPIADSIPFESIVNQSVNPLGTMMMFKG